MTTTLAHHLRRMTGRDPGEAHRAATPLELLFDLAFVVAFSQASSGLSHHLAAGHIGAAIGGFAFVMFAAGWAWINFSWFASAYDTDDWFYRVTTLVQMIGVVVLTLGIPPLFHSIDEGHYLDNGVLVAGYVVMRVAMIAQWLRVARQDPSRRTHGSHLRRVRHRRPAGLGGAPRGPHRARAHRRDRGRALTPAAVRRHQLYDYLVQAIDPFHFGLIAGTALLLAASVLAAAAGASMGTSLILITLSPFVVVVGYELLGHKHEAAMLARQLA